ncbi:MAG TPA: hypothetical protein QF753_13010 [Victivallales bacterium]|nr:hypothetical protein [Victivallales bacterium]
MKEKCHAVSRIEYHKFLAQYSAKLMEGARYYFDDPELNNLNRLLSSYEEYFIDEKILEL